ncbi:hypothetical protein KJ966_01070 [bacterium]|nr:hypothetical protein [bacterium]
MLKKRVIIRVTVLLAVLAIFASCTRLKIYLDQSGIEEIADSILSDFKTDSQQELTDYLSSYDYRQADNVEFPPEIKREPLKDWALKGDLTMERISFPSTIKKRNGENDIAHFYLYRKSNLSPQKAILWIPGFGVSDFAFRFIKEFFYAELEAGYAILFYNIPHHLNRIEEGYEMGQGLFTASHIGNLELIRHVCFEINTALDFLKKEDYQSISGWGGSIGAAFLWLSSNSFAYDHLTLMIPIVDWNSLIFHPAMAGVVKSMVQSGLSEQLIRKTYEKVNPYTISSLTDPQNIQILYGLYDQFTPESKILNFARKWGITNTHGYNESHASILINDQMYRDYAQFLSDQNQR